MKTETKKKSVTKKVVRNKIGSKIKKSDKSFEEILNTTVFTNELLETILGDEISKYDDMILDEESKKLFIDYIIAEQFLFNFLGKEYDIVSVKWIYNWISENIKRLYDDFTIFEINLLRDMIGEEIKLHDEFVLDSTLVCEFQNMIVKQPFFDKYIGKEKTEENIKFVKEYIRANLKRLYEEFGRRTIPTKTYPSTKPLDEPVIEVCPPEYLTKTDYIDLKNEDDIDLGEWGENCEKNMDSVLRFAGKDENVLNIYYRRYVESTMINSLRLWLAKFNIKRFLKCYAIFNIKDSYFNSFGGTYYVSLSSHDIMVMNGMILTNFEYIWLTKNLHLFVDYYEKQVYKYARKMFDNGLVIDEKSKTIKWGD